VTENAMSASAVTRNEVNLIHIFLNKQGWLMLLRRKQKWEGLKLLFTVLETGTPEYNSAVQALMTASGVFKGNRDELL
jgi:hypothetical protein